MSPTERSERELLLQIFDDVQDIKTNLTTVTRTLYGHEDHVGIVARVASCEERIKIIGVDVKQNKCDIDALHAKQRSGDSFLSIGKWVALAFGGLAVAFLWSVVIGEIQVIF